MIRKYQPLVLQKLNLRVPGIHVRQLALHRHLPETIAVQPHAHRFSQCLVYLNGCGKQKIGDHHHFVQAGTGVFLPPGTEHAFSREANRRPICLVIDFDWRGAGRRAATVSRLPMSVLHEVRALLSAISHLQRQGRSGPQLQMGALLLELLDLLLGSTTLSGIQPRAPLSAISRKVETLLAAPESVNLPLGELARRVGYQRDHLNRLLKSRTGLTLGQLRDRKLLEHAQRLLQNTKTVAATANTLGFSDPNYFSRWFRKQVGLSPNRWRRH